jgi:hypothetical protein
VSPEHPEIIEIRVTPGWAMLLTIGNFSGFKFSDNTGQHHEVEID